MLKKVFGPMRETVIEDWRKLLNKKLRDLFPARYYHGDKMKESRRSGG
jgi:hypothetical protein